MQKLPKFKRDSRLRRVSTRDQRLVDSSRDSGKSSMQSKVLTWARSAISKQRAIVAKYP